MFQVYKIGTLFSRRVDKTYFLPIYLNCLLLVFDTYTYDDNILFVEACTQWFLKEKLFNNKTFYAKIEKKTQEKCNFVMSYFQIDQKESYEMT